MPVGAPIDKIDNAQDIENQELNSYLFLIANCV